MSDAAGHPDDLLSTGRAARLLGVSAQMVQRWVDAGKLPGVRIPGSTFRRIYRDDLERFAAAHGLRVRDGREGTT